MTQEDQKVQELLKPRVKVIALWPFCQHHNNIKDQPRVGEIFQVSPGGSISNDAMTVMRVETYPHLFRKLEWHEERDASEMPEYVKPDPNGVLEHLRTQKTIYKVQRWVLDDNNLWCEVGKHDHIHVNHIIPATSSEYNNYNNAQKIQL